MVYYAILHPGESLADCFRVCRSCPEGFEKFNFKTNTWEHDVELFLIHAGEPEVEEITEAQANEIIARVRKRFESVQVGRGNAQRSAG